MADMRITVRPRAPIDVAPSIHDGRMGLAMEVNGQGKPGDYDLLAHKPSIEGVTLQGDKLLTDFGERALTNLEIKQAFDRVFGGN